jgi:HlyD family secretion protein
MWRGIPKTGRLELASAGWRNALREAVACGCCSVVLLGGCNDLPFGGAPSAIEVVEAAPRQVVALGRLDPAGGVISISAVPGERLLEFAGGVKEGATVGSGEVLGRLASHEMRRRQLQAIAARLELGKQEQEHERKVAAAQLEQARAAEAQASAKLNEVVGQRETLETLSEAAAIAREDLTRLRVLSETDPDLVSAHKLRRQENATARAESEARAAWSSYPLAVEAAEKSVEAAEANVRLAEQTIAQLVDVDPTEVVLRELEVAEEGLHQAEIFAPGTVEEGERYRVLKILMQPGELVTQLPILQVADVSQMVCVAEVYEADIKELQVGQRATIRSSALSGEYGEKGLRGEVRRIGTIVSNPDLESRNPLAPVDRSVVDVEVVLDPTDVQGIAEAASRIGLQVTVEFESSGVDGSGSSPGALPAGAGKSSDGGALVGSAAVTE